VLIAGCIRSVHYRRYIRVAWICEVRCIREIKRVDTELKHPRLTNRDGTKQAQVEIRCTGTIETVEVCGSKPRLCIVYRAIGRRIEVGIGIVPAENPRRFHLVRTLLATRSVETGPVRTDGKRCTGVSGKDSVQLPTAGHCRSDAMLQKRFIPAKGQFCDTA